MLHLNNEQLRAVRHVDGPMIVLAGPGSGKTAVITERINYLVGTKGVKTDSILALTFSNKAAREMQYRLNGSYSVSIGTFHSFFFQILKQYKNYSKDSIISISLKLAYIKDICNKLGISQSSDRRWCADIINIISAYKNTGTVPNVILDNPQIVFEDILEEYNKRLKNAGLIDFDDMILQSLELLKGCPSVLNVLKNRYRYILVDEFQDCNKYQYELVRMMSEDTNNLFVVGDDDQAIYNFRGSDTGIVLKFLDDYPGCDYVELIRNYRCGRNIIEAAYNLIGHNYNRKIKQKQLPSKFRGEGEVYIIKTEDAYTEAEQVYKIIQNVLQDNVKPSDITVLYRSDTASDYLVEYLTEKGIPTDKTNQDGLINKEYFKDMLAYLHIAAGDLSKEYLYRILNKPDRELVRECIGTECVTRAAMEKYYSDDCLSQNKVSTLFNDMEFIHDLKPFAAVNYVWKKTGYGRYCGNNEIPADLADFAKSFSGINEMINYNLPQRTFQGTDKIVLQTIHASKGLEYDTVILIGLQEGIMPNNKALTETELEEERRLMYVALTRAKKRLYIIARGKEDHGKKYSRFIQELNLDYKSMSL